MDQHVARRRDGKVALPPAVHLVEFGRVADGKGFARLPGAVTARDRATHANHDTHVLQNRISKMLVLLDVSGV